MEDDVKRENTGSMIHYYEIDPQRYPGGLHAVMINPGPKPGKDENPLDPDFEGEYWQPLHLGGSDKDNRPLGPWVLRFDDSIEYEADALDKFRARLDARDRRGRKVMDYVRPYEKQVTLSEADIESEVQRRVDVRLAAFQASQPAEAPAERINPQPIIIEATEGIDDDDIKPGQRRCRACGKVMDSRGYKGHMIFSIEHGQALAEHAQALAEFGVELEMKRQKVAV